MPVKAIAVTRGTQPPCKGFTLEVKVFVPQKGFRFHITVDKTCVNNEGRFGLIFELEKKIEGEFVQIVFVSFVPKPGDTQAAKGIEKMAFNKPTKKQLEVAKEEVFPAAADLEGVSNPTPPQKKRLDDAGRKMAVA
jgi:hypothetical protein